MVGTLDNLKLIRDYEQIWSTRLKRDRHVNPDNSWATNHLQLSELQRLQFAEFAWTRSTTEE